MAERGKAGCSRRPAFLFDARRQLSSPYINHFISADTIVPGYANPQNLNRYSYVTNNPLRYTDPTGHMLDYGANEGGGGCNSIACFPTPPNNLPSGGGGNGGGGHDDDDDDEDDNPSVPDLPGYDPIAIYCGESSSLGCLSFLLQDGATLVDIVGMGVVSALTITGCVVGTPGGGGGVLAGCAAGGAEGLFFYNTTGLNTAESALSFGSTVLTVIDDARQYGELGESSQTSIPATLTGLVMIDPFTDAIIDGYVSGYNHGLFNGIDHIYNGQPILVP